jgi:hypothetical protein
MTALVEFRVVAVSTNTNSFGLRQMILLSKDGHTFNACFNYLNVKQKGESIKGRVHYGNNGQPYTVIFPGGELVERGENAPKDVIKAVWNQKEQR